MSNEIANALRAMCCFAGPLAASGPDPAYPNGVVMNAVGVNKMVRTGVGSYYFVLNEPVVFDSIPDPLAGNRPPFTNALLFGADYSAGLNNTRVAMSIVPSDIPIVAPALPEIHGAVYAQIFDSEGEPTDLFYVQWGLWMFPNNGASGRPGEWPAIVGVAGSF